MSQSKLRREFGKSVELVKIGRPEDMGGSAYVQRNARGDVMYYGRVYRRPTGSPLDFRYSYLSVGIDSTAVVLTLIAVAAVAGFSVPGALLWGLWLGLAALHAHRIHRDRTSYGRAVAALAKAKATPAPPEPSPEQERRTQVRIAAEADLPYLDYDSGEIWTPERSREWLKEQERLDALRDELASAELSLSRLQDSRSPAGARRYWRNEVARLRAALEPSATDVPPVIPGEVYPSEEEWIDDDRPTFTEDELGTEWAEEEDTEVTYRRELRYTGRTEDGREFVEVPERPRGGELAKLSDGRQVGLTRSDLVMIRELGTRYVGRTITLPSGLRLTGEDVAALATELSPPAGPSVRYARTPSPAGGRSAVQQIRADLAEIRATDLVPGPVYAEPEPGSVTSSVEAHTQWARVWNEYTTGQISLETARALGDRWVQRFRALRGEGK